MRKRNEERREIGLTPCSAVPRVQQKIYTITQPGCVHFFQFVTLGLCSGVGAGELPAFFFSAADILQLLDKYSSRGSAGSVWGQQQTPRRNAEHLSPPPLALRCTASASPGRFAPLPLVATHVGTLAFSHLTFTLCHAKKANDVLQVFRCGLCRQVGVEKLLPETFSSGERGNIWRWGCKHWSCNPDLSDDNFLTTSTSKSKDLFFSAYWIFRRLTVKMGCAPSASEDIWLDHIEWMWQTHYQIQNQTLFPGEFYWCSYVGYVHPSIWNNRKKKVFSFVFWIVWNLQTFHKQIVCKMSQLCTSSMFLSAAFTHSFHWKSKKKKKSRNLFDQIFISAGFQRL